MSAQFGSMAKRMQHGFASQNGLVAALMAQSGYTGITKYTKLHVAGANFQPPYLPEELVKYIAEKWEINSVRVKPRASMAALHGTIDCAANLQRGHADRMKNFDDIESIVTEHGRAAFEHGWIAPPNKPLTTTSAQMSIQYAAATQLVDGQVLVAQFSAAKLNKPLLGELMVKIVPNHNEELDSIQGQSPNWRTNMSVKFRDGTELKESVEAPMAIKPAVSNEDIVDKWRKLVNGILDVERREQIENRVLRLKNLADIRESSKLLAGKVENLILA